MRLNPVQIKAIKESAALCFSPSARVWLFGSRVDDARRGGDIDLLVEADPADLADSSTRANRFAVQIQNRIGEQKIDVITTGRGEPDDRRIVQVARATGLPL